MRTAHTPLPTFLHHENKMLDHRLQLGPFPVFHDEHRSPIFIRDIVAVCTKVVENGNAFPYQHRVFNMGGPDGCVIAFLVAARCNFETSPSLAEYQKQTLRSVWQSVGDIPGIT